MHYIPNKTYTITHNNTYNYLNIIIIIHLNNLIQRVKELRVSSVEKNVTLFKIQVVKKYLNAHWHHVQIDSEEIKHR